MEIVNSGLTFHSEHKGVKFYYKTLDIGNAYEVSVYMKKGDVTIPINNKDRFLFASSCLRFIDLRIEETKGFIG